MTLSFTPEIITSLKDALEDAYEDILLPDVARAGVGHIQQGFYERFYGIMLDYDEAKLQPAYVADGALIRGPSRQGSRGLV